MYIIETFLWKKEKSADILKRKKVKAVNEKYRKERRRNERAWRRNADIITNSENDILKKMYSINEVFKWWCLIYSYSFWLFCIRYSDEEGKSILISIEEIIFISSILCILFGEREREKMTISILYDENERRKFVLFNNVSYSMLKEEECCLWYSSVFQCH